MRIDLTPGQAKIMAQHWAAKQMADARFQLVLDTVLADHDNATVTHMDLGADPHLILEPATPEGDD